MAEKVSHHTLGAAMNPRDMPLKMGTSFCIGKLSRMRPVISKKSTCGHQRTHCAWLTSEHLSADVIAR